MEVFGVVVDCDVFVQSDASVHKDGGKTSARTEMSEGATGLCGCSKSFMQKISVRKNEVKEA